VAIRDALPLEVLVPPVVYGVGNSLPRHSCYLNLDLERRNSPNFALFRRIR